jgi:glucose/arabinose dehydrogenase
VNSGDPYGIPADNPYATSGGAKEIFAWGLRNPYRFHIDHETNNIFIGDVGHAVWEEIDVIPAGDRGLNFGWPKCEGTHVYNGGSNSDTGACQVSGAIGPVHEYDQRDSTDPDNPCAVIGGAVYRGTCMPDMVGQYFFADKCTAKIHSFVYEEGRAPQVVNRSDDLDSERILYQNLSGFGVDGFGELYVTSLGIPPLTTPGTVYRVEVE